MGVTGPNTSIPMLKLLVFGIASCAVLVRASENSLSVSHEAGSSPHAASPHDWDFFMERYLGNFLVRRIVDSEPLAEVRDWITSFLESLGWAVEFHTFRQTVPTMDETMTGEKQFTNIIATLKPEKCKKLVFACHYESKYFSQSSNFVGAMDSAVPCAFLLSSADFFATKARSGGYPADDVRLDDDDYGSDGRQCVEGTTPQLVFFDGEEAIKQWMNGDKLYGSTALAELWEAEGRLADIELFALLDLLGPRVGWSCLLCPGINSYYESTQAEYDALVSIETWLTETGQLIPLESAGDSDPDGEFLGHLFGANKNYFAAALLDDDHRPFLNRGVENVLHLIPFPFPKNHHRESDDLSGLDAATTLNMDLILRCFFCAVNSDSVADPTRCCSS